MKQKKNIIAKFNTGYNFAVRIAVVFGVSENIAEMEVSRRTNFVKVCFNSVQDVLRFLTWGEKRTDTESIHSLAKVDLLSL